MMLSHFESEQDEKVEVADTETDEMVKKEQESTPKIDKKEEKNGEPEDDGDEDDEIEFDPTISLEIKAMRRDKRSMQKKLEPPILVDNKSTRTAFYNVPIRKRNMGLFTKQLRDIRKKRPAIASPFCKRSDVFYQVKAGRNPVINFEHDKSTKGIDRARKQAREDRKKRAQKLEAKRLEELRLLERERSLLGRISNIIRPIYESCCQFLSNILSSVKFPDNLLTFPNLRGVFDFTPFIQVLFYDNFGLVFFCDGCFSAEFAGFTGWEVF